MSADDVSAAAVSAAAVSPGARDHAVDLCRFLDASPSPFHAVAEVERRLRSAGFVAVDETAPWPSAPGRHLVVRGGALVAWVVDEAHDPRRGFRIVGAHTDSPTLKLKPRPDTGRAGWRQLGVEVYGGALLNSWLDRDLGLAGRVAVRNANANGAGGGEGGRDGVTMHRVADARPLLRVPQLAIHLDRGVNERGLVLDPQAHLSPVWGTGPATDGDLVRYLATRLDVDPADVLGFDLVVHDLTPATLLGVDESLLAGGRLDNLLSCHAATVALLRTLPATDDRPAPGPVPVICLFDHEEVGSESATGAAGNLLPAVLERICLGAGLDRDQWFRSLADSVCVSADGAHATHPNYAERHEPSHRILVNHGPVVKANANVRYATDALGGATVRLAAEATGVPLQDFVVRSDLPCGSTIGPVTAARLGITTVDVGVAQLSMHSARELCGAEDPELFTRLLTAFLGAATR